MLCSLLLQHQAWPPRLHPIPYLKSILTLVGIHLHHNDDFAPEFGSCCHAPLHVPTHMPLHSALQCCSYRFSRWSSLSPKWFVTLSAWFEEGPRASTFHQDSFAMVSKSSVLLRLDVSWLWLSFLCSIWISLWSFSACSQVLPCGSSLDVSWAIRRASSIETFVGNAGPTLSPSNMSSEYPTLTTSEIVWFSNSQ